MRFFDLLFHGWSINNNNNLLFSDCPIFLLIPHLSSFLLLREGFSISDFKAFLYYYKTYIPLSLFLSIRVALHSSLLAPRLIYSLCSQKSHPLYTNSYFPRFSSINQSINHSTMHFPSSSIILALAIPAAHVAATPFKFPTSDGFPNPSPAQLAMIQKEAGGTLPNGPLPTSLKSAGVTTLQLLALNELFEVAYFTELLANVTNDVHGYGHKAIAPFDKKYIVDSLTAVVNVSNARSHLALETNDFSPFSIH